MRRSLPNSSCQCCKSPWLGPLAGAHGNDILALAGVFRQMDGAGLRRGSGEQTQRLHKHISGTEAAGLPDLGLEMNTEWS
jgi:hypothetical protein